MPHGDSKLDTYPLRTSIGEFVSGLRELERGLITNDRIAAYMAATPLCAEAAPFLRA